MSTEARSAKVDRKRSPSASFGWQASELTPSSGKRLTGQRCPPKRYPMQPQLAFSVGVPRTWAELTGHVACLVEPHGSPQAICLRAQKSGDADTLLHRTDLRCYRAPGGAQRGSVHAHGQWSPLVG